MQFAAPMRADHVVKLLVTGPFNAGKTTLVNSVSETPSVDTDVATTGDADAGQARTTVAMDFGTYRLTDAEGHVDLLLFGTPGQPRFSFMTDIMKAGVDAVISVVDAADTSSHRDAGEAMRRLLRDLRAPLTIAVNRCDDEEEARRLARYLGALSSDSVMPCQLVDRASAHSVVIAALESAIVRLERVRGVSWRPPLERVIDSLGRAASEAA